MKNILMEVKINFVFYSTFVLFGIVGALWFYVLSVTLVIPGLMFLAIVSLGSGILTAILFRRGEKKPEHRQTNYMKKLAVRFLGKEQKTYPMDSKKGGEIIKEIREKTPTEEIPPVEIIDVEEEKVEDGTN